VDQKSESDVMEAIEQMMSKRKAALDRSTLLYGHCDNVIANISQIEQEANNMESSSEVRETVITKTNVNLDEEISKAKP
jgi:hypothetical protein